MLERGEGFECCVAEFEAFFEFKTAQVGAADYEVRNGFLIEGVVEPGEFKGFEAVAGAGKEFSPFSVGNEIGGFELETA